MGRTVAGRIVCVTADGLPAGLHTRFPGLGLAPGWQQAADGKIGLPGRCLPPSGSSSRASSAHHRQEAWPLTEQLPLWDLLSLRPELPRGNPRRATETHAGRRSDGTHIVTAER